MTAANLPPDTAERLAAWLHEQYGQHTQPDSERVRSLTEVVAQLVADARADAVHEFYLAAAQEAVKLGRRGPNAVADWLLDFGNAAIWERTR